MNKFIIDDCFDDRWLNVAVEWLLLLLLLLLLSKNLSKRQTANDLLNWISSSIGKYFWWQWWCWILIIESNNFNRTYFIRHFCLGFGQHFCSIWSCWCCGGRCWQLDDDLIIFIIMLYFSIIDDDGGWLVFFCQIYICWLW